MMSYSKTTVSFTFISCSDNNGSNLSNELSETGRYINLTLFTLSILQNKCVSE